MEIILEVVEAGFPRMIVKYFECEKDAISMQ